MTRKTGSRWSTERCGRCEQAHTGYSGKIDGAGDEYVVCGTTHKKMRVSPAAWRARDIAFTTTWTRDPQNDTVVPFQSRDELAQEAMEERLKQTGPLTTGIFDMEAKLEAEGWRVELFSNELPELTAHVDYDEKTAIINIHKAGMTLELLERIMAFATGPYRARGKVVYRYERAEFYNGEEPDSRFSILTVSAKP